MTVIQLQAMHHDQPCLLHKAGGYVLFLYLVSHLALVRQVQISQANDQNLMLKSIALEQSCHKSQETSPHQTYYG